MPHFVVTANRLSDGIAVWRAEGSQWATHIQDAAVFDADTIAAELAAATSDIGRQLVVGVYQTEATLQDGMPVPASVRETIRSRGPSVRLDLGIQAAPAP